jgi:NADH-quinone oxidoreductase subunit L
MPAILVLSVILFPWAGAAAVWLARDHRPRLQHSLAVGFSLLAGFGAAALVFNTGNDIVFTIPLGRFFEAATFRADGLGAFLTLVAAGIGSLTVIFSVDYMRGQKQLGRYYFLVLVFIGAMCGLVLSNSMLMLFFFWEITAFCSYALISFYNEDPKAVAGGIKALVMTQLGGVGLLASALVVYANLGTFEIDVFLREVGIFPKAALTIMAFGILAAAAAKSAQVPFFTWLPDAMEAPTPVSALIHAATMVNAGVYLLARFYPAFSAVPGWKLAVLITGLVTALIAAIMAAVSVDLKRVLAYSTVSQLGYMVYAIGAGGVLASQFHLLSHAIFKALLFLAAGAVIHTIGTRDMRQMGGLGRQMPFVRNVFIIGALALAGIPILNGFWSKELILEAGLQGGPAWAFWLMAAGAGLTGLYTLRMVWMVFFGNPFKEQLVHDAKLAMKVALGLLGAGTLLSWMLVGPFSKILARSALLGEVHGLSLAHLVSEITATPATWIVFALIVSGAFLWLLRDRLTWLRSALVWVVWAAEASFGFEWLNKQVVAWFSYSANFLRRTQTGILNWNVLGITAGLLIVMLYLFLWN